MHSGNRLLVYDATSRPGQGLLRSSWATGARIYRALGRIDGFYGAESWEDALRWLSVAGADRPISEVQFWGHGHWGEVLIGDERLNAASFDRGHRLRPLLDAFKKRLLDRGASLVWLRTCESFGADAGQAFAARLANELDARVAGHTYVIGALQSGLHGLRPGEVPRWRATEGIAEGTASAPRRAHVSLPEAPHTIHFMNGRFDPAWFDS